MRIDLFTVTQEVGSACLLAVARGSGWKLHLNTFEEKLGVT
jgi:hypothetical protein